MPEELLGGHDELDRLAGVFKLLGDPTRMRLVAELHRAAGEPGAGGAPGERCVGDLAAATGARESAVSQALRLLRAASIVAVRRDGRHMRYRLADDHVRELLDTAAQHLRHSGPIAPAGDDAADCDAPHPAPAAHPAAAPAHPAAAPGPASGSAA